jgi:hypothetical protein
MPSHATASIPTGIVTVCCSNKQLGPGTRKHWQPNTLTHLDLEPTTNL